ncbi:TerC family protein [Candidatus Ishikawella capsulata]|nr:TerC family protein [Candidatus Ishikawaella capsulata]
MFTWTALYNVWFALGTLTVLEIVLGIDNIIFLSLVVSKLPYNMQNRARLLGIIMAMIMRVMLLMCVTFIGRMTHPIFHLFHHEFSIRDLFLFNGGFFLVWKSSREIYETIKDRTISTNDNYQPSFIYVIIQIMFLDIIFSLDSVITAVGLSNNLHIMICAILISVFFMLYAAKIIGEFIEKHPSIKILALTFLNLVGWMLVLESERIFIVKSYIYFAMLFSIIVEILNWLRTNNIY